MSYGTAALLYTTKNHKRTAGQRVSLTTTGPEPSFPPRILFLVHLLVLHLLPLLFFLHLFVLFLLFFLFFFLILLVLLPLILLLLFPLPEIKQIDLRLDQGEGEEREKKDGPGPVMVSDTLSPAVHISNS